jgi:hypothetical protein
MTFRTWNLAAAAAMVALTGCAGLQTDDESTTTEELSVLNWSADFLTAGNLASRLGYRCHPSRSFYIMRPCGSRREVHRARS